MLSLPDFRAKQLLYIDADWNHRSRLSFLNDNIVFTKDDAIVNRASVHKVLAVFIIGDLSVTTQFIKKSKEYGISIFLLKRNFEMYGSLLALAEGHYVLRARQYAYTQAGELAIAKQIITNKVNNQFAALREYSESSRYRVLENLNEKSREQIQRLKTNERLLGTEGAVSRRFYKEYFHEFYWRRRAPRTKEDITNFLMDMGYTFLFNIVDTLLRLHGFDTFKGCYHKLFFQRRSLACDIMEPFRCLIDKQIRKAYNLKQITKEDFTVSNGIYSLPFQKHAKYASLFLDCLMKRKEEMFSYVHGYYRHIMDPKQNPFPYFEFDKMK